MYWTIGLAGLHCSPGFARGNMWPSKAEKLLSKIDAGESDLEMSGDEEECGQAVELEQKKHLPFIPYVM